MSSRSSGCGRRISSSCVSLRTPLASSGDARSSSKTRRTRPCERSTRSTRDDAPPEFCRSALSRSSRTTYAGQPPDRAAAAALLGVGSGREAHVRNGRAVLGRGLRALRDEAGLPDPARADDRHDRPSPRRASAPRPAQSPHIESPTDDRRHGSSAAEAPSAADGRRRAVRLEAERERVRVDSLGRHAEDADRLGQPFQLDLAVLVQLDSVQRPGEMRHALAGQDLARPRLRAEPAARFSAPPR